jgi:tRNA G46 methylase TrmB
MNHDIFVGDDHTTKYRLHRPNYPKELFKHIIDYYFDNKITNEKIPVALDVGCGSGQATVDLSL